MGRKSLFLLALCAIAVIVAYRASGWDFDWTLFFSSLSGLKPGWLMASVAVTLTTYGLRAMRWQVLLAPLKSIPILRLLSVTLVGFSAIYALGRAGEVVRPVWLTRREGVPIGAAVATIVVERVLDMLTLVVLFGTALLIIDVPAASAPTLELLKSAAWMVAAAALGGVVLFILLRSQAARIARWIPFRRIAALIENFAEGLSTLQSRRSLRLVLAHSVILWIAIALQFWFMLLGLNFTLTASAAALVLVGAAIGSIAQVPGIGGGFQAGYVFSLTALFQVPAEQAVATSLVATIFSYGPTIAVAGIYMLTQGITMRDLKTPTANPESEAV